MTDSLSAGLLAFAGYTLLNLGQAGQKIGLGMRHNRALLAWTVWAVATAATAVSFWLVFFAITLGSVTVAGALAGTGLASLAVFSRVVMKESLRVRDAISVPVIIAGAVGVALLQQSTGGRPNTLVLHMFLGAGVLVYGSGTVIAFVSASRSQAGAPARATRRQTAGVLLGGLSGFLGAASQLYQELGTSETTPADGLRPFFGAVLRNPITALWVGLSLLSMVVIQFAYDHGEAIGIIPVFTANFIVVPVVGGVVVFGQYLTPLQWISVAAILAGSVVLGRRKATAGNPSVAGMDSGNGHESTPHPVH